MKIILKNSKLVFVSKPLPEEHKFSIAYDDVVNYNLQGDVNLLYIGDIHIGDKVTVTFDQDNNTGSSIVCYTKSKSDGSYKEPAGLGVMRWVGTGLTSGTITANAECSNIKFFISNKVGTVIETIGKVSGKVVIERA